MQVLDNYAIARNLSELYTSVIIPVYNDYKRLKICLEALENQTYPKHLYEIIVIDNNLTENIASVVKDFRQATLIHEIFPGSYAARNKGISQAKGKILAFTDSDCIPAVNWIEQGVITLNSIPNCGLIAGKIEFYFLNSEKLTPVELYETIEIAFDQENNIKELHFGVTANLFTFKHVMNSVGAFNGAIKSGGDRLWGEKVFNAGYQQAYADSVYIRHPARHSFFQLYKRITRFVGGEYDIMILLKRPSILTLGMDFIGMLRPPVRIFYRIWVDSRLTSDEQKIQFICVMLFVKYVVISEKIRLYLGFTSKRE